MMSSKFVKMLFALPVKEVIACHVGQHLRRDWWWGNIDVNVLFIDVIMNLEFNSSCAAFSLSALFYKLLPVCRSSVVIFSFQLDTIKGCFSRALNLLSFSCLSPLLFFDSTCPWWREQIGDAERNEIGSKHFDLLKESLSPWKRCQWSQKTLN